MNQPCTLLRRWVQVAPTRKFSCSSLRPKSPFRQLSCVKSVSEAITKAQGEASDRPPRFYVDESLTAAAGQLIDLGPEESKHAAKALRLAVEDEVELCDGRGGLLTARIAVLGKNSVTVEAVSAVRKEAWRGPQWEVAAGFSMLKGGRADWLVEKCTELGAHALLPLVSNRVHGAGSGWKIDSRPSKNREDSPHGRQARWERVAVAATKQSLRAYDLVLRPQMPLVQFLEEVKAAKLALIAAAGGPELLEHREMEAALSELRDGDTALLIVGPEGDFTPAELDSLIEAGAHPVGLGLNRLRVETAAIALLAAVTTYHRSKRSAAA